MWFNKIPVIYINLDSRPDRNEHVKEQLDKVGFKTYERFRAIQMENGALGCSMSHLKCLEFAKKNNFESIFICEDDIEFLDPSLFLKQIQGFLDSGIEWDVILVAGNNMLPYTPVNNNCIKVFNCQTTTGYIVKKAYYDKLMQNYKDGIEKLMREPDNNDFKIDKYWFRLQRNDNWYLIIPLTIVQKEDYSDIEKKVTNFKKYMLDYNKAYKK